MLMDMHAHEYTGAPVFHAHHACPSAHECAPVPVGARGVPMHIPRPSVHAREDAGRGGRLREAPYERAYLQAVIANEPGTRAYSLAGQGRGGDSPRSKL